MPASPKKTAAPATTTVDKVHEELHNVVKRMDQVEKRLLKNEKQLDGPVESTDVNTNALRDYQMNLLTQLRQLRDTMNQEGSCLEKIRQERDEAMEERDVLKKQMAKLEYRLFHLKKHVPLPK